MKTENVVETAKPTDKISPAVNERLEAIAWGVQARFEESTGYSKKVTDETINIARSLGLANHEIEKWAARRLNRIAHETERLRAIMSLLDKTYGKSLSTKGTRG
jgi:hypothetical protein